MKRTIIAAVLILLGANQANAFCRVPKFYFHLGSDVSVSMIISNGGKCSVGANAGGSRSYDGIVLTRQPAHGTLLVKGKSGVLYILSNGYRGTDSFTYRLNGHDGTSPASSNFDVSVTAN